MNKFTTEVRRIFTTPFGYDVAHVAVSFDSEEDKKKLLDRVKYCPSFSVLKSDDNVTLEIDLKDTLESQLELLNEDSEIPYLLDFEEINGEYYCTFSSKHQPHEDVFLGFTEDEAFHFLSAFNNNASDYYFTVDCVDKEKLDNLAEELRNVS